MTTRPASNEFAPVVEKYVNRVPDGDVRDYLKELGETTAALLRSLTEDEADYRYAEGKWSVKEVIGHCIDNERIWAYRLLRIARNDAKELPGYDENIVAAHAPYAGYTRDRLAAEYNAVRIATLALLSGLPNEAWLRTGTFGGHPLSVRAAAYVIGGHEDHHIHVIKERYLAR